MAIEEQRTVSGPETPQSPKADTSGEIRAALVQELAKRREAGEISPDPYDDADLYYIVNGKDNTLTRKDLEAPGSKPQAIDLSLDHLRILDEDGGLFVIAKSGQRIYLDPNSFANGVILFPEDLGNKEDEMRWNQSHPAPSKN